MDIMLDFKTNFPNGEMIFVGPSMAGAFGITAYLYSEGRSITCDVTETPDLIRFRGTYYGAGIVELCYVKCTREFIITKFTKPFRKNKWSIIIYFDVPAKIGPVGKAVHKKRSLWSRLFRRKEVEDYSHLRISGGNQTTVQDLSSSGSIRSVVFRSTVQ